MQLRYKLASMVADEFASSGFDAIVQDVIIGRDLHRFIARISTPDRFLVVLSPTVSALEWREEQRQKAGYVYFSAGALDHALRKETEHIGYWLDSSAQTPEETVATFWRTWNWPGCETLPSRVRP